MRTIRLLFVGAQSNPTRTLVTAISITLCFLLFGLLYSISAGFEYTLNWLSADSLRVTSKIHVREPLPLSYLTRIEQTPRVVGVEYASIFSSYYREPNQRVGGAAIAPERLQFFPHLRFEKSAQAAMQQLRTGAIVGRALADRFGWRAGQKVTLMSTNVLNRKTGPAWTFDIVGIYEMEGNAKLANEFYANYQYINEARVVGQNTVNIYIVRITDPDASRIVAHSIDTSFSNSGAETLTRSDREWVGATIRKIGDIQLLVNFVLGASLFTLFILTRNALAQSVRERTSDFGVLKVLGFSDLSILGLLLCEALVLCVGGATIGLIAAMLLAPWFAQQIQMSLFIMPPRVMLTGLMLSIALALLASLPPGIGIVRLSPATALLRK